MVLFKHAPTDPIAMVTKVWVFNTKLAIMWLVYNVCPKFINQIEFFAGQSIDDVIQTC